MACLIDEIERATKNLSKTNLEINNIKESFNQRIDEQDNSQLVIMEAIADIYETQQSLKDSQLVIMEAIADLYEIINANKTEVT